MLNFPQQLKDLLSYHHTVLDADLRMVRPVPRSPVLNTCPVLLRFEL